MEVKKHAHSIRFITPNRGCYNIAEDVADREMMDTTQRKYDNHRFQVLMSKIAVAVILAIMVVCGIRYFGNKISVVIDTNTQKQQADYNSLELGQ